jgi:hypothetical protein
MMHCHFFLPGFRVHGGHECEHVVWASTPSSPPPTPSTVNAIDHTSKEILRAVQGIVPPDNERIALILRTLEAARDKQLVPMDRCCTSRGGWRGGDVRTNLGCQDGCGLLGATR